MGIKNRYFVQCPMRLTLSIINGKWKAIILFLIRQRPRRFGELRRFIPEVTQKVLTQHLRELEEDGVVGRQVLGGIPPKVQYYLTDLGKSLEPILDQMAQWGTEHKELFIKSEK